MGFWLLKLNAAGPALKLPLRSMPSCLITVRSISATVILIITWSWPRTVMAFTTLSPLMLVGLVADAEQPRRDVESHLRLGRAGDVAGQEHAVPDGFHLNFGFRQRLLDGVADAVEIALDRDVESADLAAFGVEEEDVGLAHGRPDDEGTPSRADDRVGNLGVGDQHVLDVARQLDHHRLSDPERNEARILVAAHHLDSRGVGVADPLIARRGRAGRDDCERRDQCRKRYGSGQYRSGHVAIPRRRARSGRRHHGVAEESRAGAADAGRARTGGRCDGWRGRKPVDRHHPPAIRRLEQPIDGGHDATRGFHTLTFHMTRRPRNAGLGAGSKGCPVPKWSPLHNSSR